MSSDIRKDLTAEPMNNYIETKKDLSFILFLNKLMKMKF